MSTKALVKSLVLTNTQPATIESEIGAIVTAQEAFGFVLDQMFLIGNTVSLHFKHQSVLPGGGGLQDLKLTFDFAALSAAALTKTLPIPSVPSSLSPVVAAVDVTTAFAGAGIGTLGLEVGDTADPNGILASVDLLTTGVKGVGGAAYIGSVQNAMAPEVLATAIGANLDQLTQGEATVTISYRKWRD